MKRSVLLLLVVEAGLAMAVFGQAQVVVPPRARFPQHQPHKLRQQGLTPLLAQPSLLPATATRDVIQVNCPVEAQALGAVCGYVPVPLHRDRPNGETINIYFEIYAHSNPGPAQSAIVPNAGGPSLTTSGLRFLWLGLFGANLDAHDLLLIDDRGRGMSALIDCQELQHGTGSSIDHEAADCAAQLGDDDSSYGTGDVALDVEAVRAALGYEKLDYYGGSYGAMDASAYATRFGEHLRSVILDSPAGARSLVPFVQRYSTAAVPREVHLDCLRSPTCGVDHPNPDTELDWLIGTVRSKPVQGVAHDANGNPVNVDFNEIVLTQIATNPNFGYLDIGELLAGHPPALVGEHRADVIDAVGIRHEAVVADLLGDLLDRAMEIADVGDGLLHHLAVGAHHEAQHAVRRGMLRPHVERHLFGVKRAHFFFC